MYAAHFGLCEPPFNNTPDPRFFFTTSDHEEALACLIYTVQEMKGYALLTGEVGAGKTLLLRMMLRRFGDRIASAVINNTCLSADGLLAAICAEFALPGVSSVGRFERVAALQDYLLTRYAADTPVVLVLDEAQNLSDEAFEQVRMIGNLEADSAKLLQIVIAGQPELRQRFRTQHLRQLNQRIFRRFHLPALSREDCAAYVRHRLSVAGAAGDAPSAPLPSIFDDQALAAVYAFSGGLPRLINTACDNAMLAAYAADRTTIDGPFMRDVIAHAGWEPVAEAEPSCTEKTVSAGGALRDPNAEREPRHAEATTAGDLPPPQQPQPSPVRAAGFIPRGRARAAGFIPHGRARAAGFAPRGRTRTAGFAPRGQARAAGFIPRGPTSRRKRRSSPGNAAARGIVVDGPAVAEEKSQPQADAEGQKLGEISTWARAGAERMGTLYAAVERSYEHLIHHLADVSRPGPLHHPPSRPIAAPADTGEPGARVDASGFGPDGPPPGLPTPAAGVQGGRQDTQAPRSASVGDAPAPTPPFVQPPRQFNRLLGQTQSSLDALRLLLGRTSTAPPAPTQITGSNAPPGRLPYLGTPPTTLQRPARAPQAQHPAEAPAAQLIRELAELAVVMSNTTAAE